METILKFTCWLPLLVLTATLVCLSLRSLRPFAPRVLFLPICTAFGFLVSVFPPFSPMMWLRGLGAAAWVVGIAIGIVSGAWLGILLSGVAQSKVRDLSVPVLLLLLLVVTIIIVPVYYLPHAYLNEMFGGGSGYGHGTPKFFLKAITRTYFPLFRALQGKGLPDNIVLYILCGVVTVGQVALVVNLAARIWMCRSGSRGVISSPLPHHRTCGSASGGSEGLP